MRFSAMAACAHGRCYEAIIARGKSHGSLGVSLPARSSLCAVIAQHPYRILHPHPTAGSKHPAAPSTPRAMLCRPGGGWGAGFGRPRANRARPCNARNALRTNSPFVAPRAPNAPMRVLRAPPAAPHCPRPPQGGLVKARARRLSFLVCHGHAGASSMHGVSWCTLEHSYRSHNGAELNDYEPALSATTQRAHGHSHYTGEEQKRDVFFGFT